eukprot:4707984-Amphidinium_carterae.1
MKGASVSGTLGGTAGGGAGGSAGSLTLGCSSSLSRSWGPTNLQKWCTFIAKSCHVVSGYPPGVDICLFQVSFHPPDSWARQERIQSSELEISVAPYGRTPPCLQGLDGLDHTFAVAYHFVRVALF